MPRLLWAGSRWARRDGSAQRGLGLIRPIRGPVSKPQVAMGEATSWRDHDSLLERCDGSGVITGLLLHDTQQVQRVEMSGVDRQGPAAEGFRFRSRPAP